jgi:hypothetical protein
MRYLCTCLLLLSLVVGAAACSDDSGPPREGGVIDLPLTGSEGALPWPDQAVKKDTTPSKCSAGAAGMCGDNKRLYCLSGVCTDCPPNYVDCDRQGDCECVGACNGNKCVTK